MNKDICEKWGFEIAEIFSPVDAISAREYIHGIAYSGVDCVCIIPCYVTNRNGFSV